MFSTWLKGLKDLKSFEKKFPDLKIFPLILAENPVFPWFPWLEKVFKIYPDRWKPCLCPDLPPPRVATGLFLYLFCMFRQATISV